MDIRDPTLVDIRQQPFGSSRDGPGKERGRALYTKRPLAQDAPGAAGRAVESRVAGRELFRRAGRGDDARLVGPLHGEGVFAIPRPGLGDDAVAIDRPRHVDGELAL